MRSPQLAIRALLVGTLIAGIFGGAAIQGTRRMARPASSVRLLDSRPDLASAHRPPAILFVPAAREQPVSQIVFAGPEGASVTWDVTATGMFDSDPLTVPGRYNFPCGAIYQLKLTNVPGHEGLVVYPTLEVAPPLPHTEGYLDKNAIPLQFTEEDFDQILSGKVVAKVIYLPGSEHQDPAFAGVETIVSTHVDPGLDPIVEADRRGTILAIVRLGDINVLDRCIWIPGDVLLNPAPATIPPVIAPGALLPLWQTGGASK